MRARLLTLVVGATAFLALAGIAQAHVTVHPNALPSGGFTVVNVQVPNEQDKASTVKVDMQLPPGIFFLSTQPIPGWTAKVTYRKLAKPVKLFGALSTQEVGRVTWTAKPGTLGPGTFQSFPVSLRAPEAKAGTIVVFKVLQTYSNGEISRWIGAAGADAPAPQVMIRSANAPVQDYPAGVSAITGKAKQGAVFALPAALLAALGLGVARRRRSA